MKKEFELINDKELKTLELTFEELVFIDDKLTLGVDALEFKGVLPIRIPEREKCVVAHLGMIYKVGAYLNKFIELEEDLLDKSLETFFNDSELLLLREIAHSGQELKDKIGLSLKLKINNALFSKKYEGIWKVIEEHNKTM